MVKMIWNAGGFRFTRTSMSGTFPSSTYVYHCSQDAERARTYRPTVEVRWQRNGRRMQRASCDSKLNIRPSLQNRTLSLSIRHRRCHKAYVDVALSPELRALIYRHASNRTTTETYQEVRRELRDSMLVVSRSQMYYIWQMANCDQWLRGSDALDSAKNLLQENGRYGSVKFTEGNVRALCVYATQTIGVLGRSTRQVAMDSTFGTNSSGMDLYAVLAEFEGMGVPARLLFHGSRKRGWEEQETHAS